MLQVVKKLLQVVKMAAKWDAAAKHGEAQHVTAAEADDLIDTLKNEDQTADYVRNKIKISEMKNQKEHATSCQEAATRCQDGSQVGRSGEAWRGSTRDRSRGRAGRGNYGRGRGNFHGQQGTSTSEQSGEDASAWIATTPAAYTNETNRSCISEIE